MKRILLIGLGCISLLLGCRQDAGEPLFELLYQPREFTIPAGYSPFQQLVFEYNNVPTNYGNFLDNSGHSRDEVTSVVPLFARLSSLDGLDFDFLHAISVRVCPIGGEPCSEFDEVFYLDDLYGRQRSVLNLDPGLRNVVDLLSGDLYKMEIIFFSAEVTPYVVDCRFEYGFEAVK